MTRVHGNMLVGWVIALGLMASASLSLLPWLQTSSELAQPPTLPTLTACQNYWLRDPARGELLAAQQHYYAAVSSDAAPVVSCHG